jgi:hypothetical protein
MQWGAAALVLALAAWLQIGDFRAHLKGMLP